MRMPHHLTSPVVAYLTAVAILAGGSAGAVTSLLTAPPAVNAATPSGCPKTSEPAPAATAAAQAELRWCTYKSASTIETVYRNTLVRLGVVQASVNSVSKNTFDLNRRLLALEAKVKASAATVSDTAGMEKLTTTRVQNISQALRTPSGRSIGNLLEAIAAKLHARI
jgi:citrate lyase gamma subunit